MTDKLEVSFVSLSEKRHRPGLSSTLLCCISRASYVAGVCTSISKRQYCSCGIIPVQKQLHILKHEHSTTWKKHDDPHMHKHTCCKLDCLQVIGGQFLPDNSAKHEFPVVFPDQLRSFLFLQTHHGCVIMLKTWDLHALEPYLCANTETSTVQADGALDPWQESPLTIIDETYVLVLWVH